MQGSVRQNYVVFGSGFSREHSSPTERLHSEALLQGRLKSRARSQPAPACHRACAFTAQRGLAPTFLSWVFFVDLFCAGKLQRVCLLFCALYNCFIYSCLWASLFPEASDLEAYQDKINSNDLGVGNLSLVLALQFINCAAVGFNYKMGIMTPHRVHLFNKYAFSAC